MTLTMFRTFELVLRGTPRMLSTFCSDIEPTSGLWCARFGALLAAPGGGCRGVDSNTLIAPLQAWQSDSSSQAKPPPFHSTWYCCVWTELTLRDRLSTTRATT